MRKALYDTVILCLGTIESTTSLHFTIAMTVCPGILL